VNNYAQISFNLGPTLLSYLEVAAPAVHRAVQEADRESQGRFSGHGSAIAQVYNHAILPLCNEHDRRTQVRWGLRDFEHRFGRRPEGMWLAETAVNIPSLEALAEAGIAYTVLAPRQARRVRRLSGGGWKDVSPDRVDPSRAYLARLPSGRSINLFFYDGPISRAVAFEGLLSSGERLAARLCGGFSEARGWPQLVHIATDGETYGHHHPRGDMALAYALHHIEAQGLAELTNYGEFLERHPPTHEVEIEEDTSWSCAHGIERWRSDCGCNSGMRAGWGQSWRAPLREALDFLRDCLAPFFEARWRARFQDRDPWAARDEYIDVVLDRSRDSVERFLLRHAGPGLTPEARVTALRLMEMQRHAMLMYTSCGWFFDEISGIETVQVLRYACRALQLARQLAEEAPIQGPGPGQDTPRALDLDAGALEHGLLQRLARVPSNLPEQRDGRHIYERLIAPGALTLQRVGTHYAVSSLFSDYEEDARVYCYQVERLDHQFLRAGKARLSLGRVRITSLLTTEQAEISFGALHLLDHHIAGGVRPSPGAAAHAAMAAEIADLFQRGDLPQLLRSIDLRFGPETYSLRSLFYDEQRRILEQVLEGTLKEAEEAHRRLYRDHADLLRFLSDQGVPVPRALLVAAEFALNTDLRRLFRAPALDAGRVRAVLGEARQAGVSLDEQELAYALRRAIERVAAPLRDRPEDLDALCRLDDAVALAREMPFAVNFWEVQNIFYGLLASELPQMRARAALGDAAAERWAERVAMLGERLQVQVPEGGPESRGEILRGAMSRRRVPRCTYRLQFGPSLTFHDAAALVPYLHALGVSDLYASPVFRALAGSPHGYDVCGHGELNPELGGEEGFDALSAALRERGMGLLLDVVPNHMSIATPMNPWWMDVLENGRSSAYAAYFDIDWHPATPELGEKVLLSILEDQYGKVLEQGKLQLHQDEGTFYLSYYEHRFPVAPRTYVLIMGHALPALEAALAADDPALQEYKSILTALSYLPPRTETDPARLEERGREKEIIKRRLAALQRESAAVRAALEEAVRDLNGVVGEPRSFDLLDQLIEAQAYRLSYWRVAAEEINYRRFFDINELAAIRVEVPEVFEATHRLVLRLLLTGKVTGLRIDHADGLWDPLGYLRQLQTTHFLRQVRARLGSAIPPAVQAEMEREAARWLSSAMEAMEAKEAGSARWPLYVAVEKILAAGEELPAGWPVDGTTGYDFLASVGGLFLDPRGEAPLHALYLDLGGAEDYPALVHDTKKMIMRVALASEINALGHKLERISKRNRRYRDYTLNGLIFALREIIACLQVYRTYITGPGAVSERDQRYLEAAAAEARRRNPGTAGAIFDFVRDTLLLRDLDDFREPDRDELIGFTMKFQQITGPVMAKGVEDTAFYVYNRLVSLNEVGGDPSRWGTTVEEFHAGCAARHKRWPHAQLCTTTHDTKRGEDVRARLHVLTEMPLEWGAFWGRYLERSASLWGEPEQETPSRNDQYLLLQTLIGTWPEGPPEPPGLQGRPLGGAALSAYRERIADYMRKAAREAKVHTSWINPNDGYEAALRDLVTRLLPEEPGESDELRADIERLARRVSYFGRLNGLSQRALHLCAPGVPDLYQGTELWGLQLVDPDNRRPVDFAARKEALEALERRAGDPEALCQELLESAWDGRIKLYVTWRLLGLRRELPALFLEGGYEPVEAAGERAGHVCAFARLLTQEDGALVFALVVAPRLVLGLTGGAERPPLGAEVWGDTHLLLPAALGAARCRDVFTGAEIAAVERDGAASLPLAEVLRRFPVAVLHGVA
jgi:(1->4)-alpha-D-glucan 1-alpha-D-glucosylmutase